MASDVDITRLLQQGSGGEEGALSSLLPIVYDDLRAIAHQRLRGERTGHTLNTTALVHEAYVRLVDQTRVQWRDRAHFFGVAAEAMRRILVDYARRRGARKRGAGLAPLALDEVEIAVVDRAEQLLALDDALDRLEALDERLARVVVYRFFGGLSEDEIAEVIGVTPRTVRRDWVKARGWLYRELAA